MALLAPIIAGGCVLLVGLAALVWMNRTQPVLQKSPTDAKSEPSQGSDVLVGGKLMASLAQSPYLMVDVHHE
jgi:hypothetical protein